MATPAASESQKQVLTSMVDLAQTASLDTANQIALVDKQKQGMEDMTALFEDRYNHWHKFISLYEKEVKLIQGPYLINPLPLVATANYPLPGNPFSDFVNTETSILEQGTEEPKRISEFDGMGDAGYFEENETKYFVKEIEAKNILVNGFNDGTIIGSIQTAEVVTPSTPVVTFTSVNGGSIQVNMRIVILGPASSCIAKVTSVSYNEPENSGDPHTWEVGLEFLSDFTSIPTGASVAGSLTGFNNTERTNKVASTPARQSILNSLMASYYQVIDGWHDNLVLQLDVLIEEKIYDEESFNEAYSEEVQELKQILFDWLTTDTYSDSSLLGIQALRLTREVSHGIRIPFITGRISDSNSHDERYKYTNLLFNKAVGSYVMATKFAQQKQILQAQQPVLAQRAAAFAQENF